MTTAAVNPLEDPDGFILSFFSPDPFKLTNIQINADVLPSALHGELEIAVDEKTMFKCNWKYILNKSVDAGAMEVELKDGENMKKEHHVHVNPKKRTTKIMFKTPVCL